MTDLSNNEKATESGGDGSWRSLGVPKRVVLALAGLIAFLVVPYLVWIQTSRVRYLDINSGATKETVEVFGIPVSSSPMLPAVHEAPGLPGEWRRTGATGANGIACGPWGRAAADYRAIGNALDGRGVDQETRAEIFGVWRGYLHGNVPGYLDYSYASDDGPPVAARIDTDGVESLVIFDLRD